MTSAQQDREFFDAMMDALRNDRLLDIAVAWISKTFNPDDVFSEHDMEVWAEDHGYVKDDTLQSALRDIRDLAAENADLDADQSDKSPEDANQWRFGIILQECQKALGET